MRSLKRKTCITGHNKATKKHASAAGLLPKKCENHISGFMSSASQPLWHPFLHWVYLSHSFKHFWANISMCAIACFELSAGCCSTSGWSCKTNLLFLQSRQTHEKRQDRLAASDMPAAPMLWGSGEACTSPFGEQLLFACSWWSQLHLETRSEPIKHRGRLPGSGVCKAGRQAKAWLQNFTSCKERKGKGGKKPATHTAYWAIVPA